MMDLKEIARRAAKFTWVNFFRFELGRMVSSGKAACMSERAP